MSKSDSAISRRQAIQWLSLTAGAAGSMLRPGALLAQQTATPANIPGDTLYLHPHRGSDGAAGTKSSPLRTLTEAAHRVNQSKGSGPLTIVLSEGIYAVSETVRFKPEHRSFSSTARLTIRAEVLPDDPVWHTGRMPTLIHTMELPEGGAASGIEIETSHVTIQGLKVLGVPAVENPKPGFLQRVYPIVRSGRDLDDPYRSYFSLC
jgi:hypothetical protein